MGLVALSAVALILVAGLANAVLNGVERRSIPAYGERVAVTGGELNVYRHGDSGPTVVLLGGYSTAAPAIDFAPLIRELDGYRVVVIEGFGYGYSDTDAPPRTIENITTELHEAVTALRLEKPYVLLGHSIAGIYDLYYANRYPEEVAAIISVDTSVPGQDVSLEGLGHPAMTLVSGSGLLRVASAVAPSLVVPDGTAYTAAELDRIRIMTNWHWANPAQRDEANHGARNFAAVEGMTYPRELPVLSFIKKEGNQPRWRALHEAQVADRPHGELVELDGGHYLHWTHSPQMARKITEFLSTAGVTG